ncbi:MAG: pilus assembly protein [Pirellulales bacterium]|nr:pilus assembly protein [Pirellulales bacterium]
MSAQRKRQTKFRRQHRAGATATEFAIVAPIFFLFIFVSFEFSRLNVIRHTADSAAYEAARQAMVPGRLRPTRWRKPIVFSMSPAPGRRS